MSSPSLEIELRPLSSDFSAEFFDLIDGNREYFGEYLDWVKNIPDTDSAFDYLSDKEEEEDDGTAVHRFITTNGLIIGQISLYDIKKSGTGEVGYCVGSAYSGRGVATRSTALMLRLAFEERRLHKVLLRAHRTNGASNAVAIRNGFSGVPLGIMETSSRYNFWELTADEFLARVAVESTAAQVSN